MVSDERMLDGYDPTLELRDSSIFEDFCEFDESTACSESLGDMNPFEEGSEDESDSFRLPGGSVEVCLFISWQVSLASTVCKGLL